MSHGEKPIPKRVSGRMTKAPHCESCGRQIKIRNACVWHTVREPCYFCHLILQHFANGDVPKENKSSPKKSLVQKT